MQLAGGRLREAQLLDALSGRERQVLNLVACGQSNAGIAAELGLTEATVKSYVSALLTKLGVTNRVQAALFVQRVQGGAS
jgi:DNA-binding NarL/FixJ family response regulator